MTVITLMNDRNMRYTIKLLKFYSRMGHNNIDPMISTYICVQQYTCTLNEWVHKLPLHVISIVQCTFYEIQTYAVLMKCNIKGLQRTCGTVCKIQRTSESRWFGLEFKHRNSSDFKPMKFHFVQSRTFGEESGRILRNAHIWLTRFMADMI